VLPLTARIIHSDLIRLVLAQICVHGGMTGLRMAAPLRALDLGYSPMAVGVLLSLFSLTQVFIAVPVGRYADKVGLRPLMALAVPLAMLAGVVAALWPVFAVLCGAALASGGATGLTVIALQRYVTRRATMSQDIKTAFSWLALGPAVSNFLGPLLAGGVIDHAGMQPGDGAGFQWAFLAMGIVPGLSWISIRGVPEGPHGPPAAPGAPTRAWDLLRQPRMRCLLGVNAVLASCYDLHTVVVPMLAHERGMSASAIGAILAAFALAAAVIRLALPWLSQHAQEYQIITAAMVATALLFMLYPFMRYAWAMGVCSVGLGLALASVQPMIMSTLQHMTPPARRGEALGLRLMCVTGSSVIMPNIFGVVITCLGVSWIFWGIGAIAILGAPGVRRLRLEDADQGRA
jgi:MFS family permease